MRYSSHLQDEMTIKLSVAWFRQPREMQSFNGKLKRHRLTWRLPCAKVRLNLMPKSVKKWWQVPCMMQTIPKRQRNFISPCNEQMLCSWTVLFISSTVRTEKHRIAQLSHHIASHNLDYLQCSKVRGPLFYQDCTTNIVQEPVSRDEAFVSGLAQQFFRRELPEELATWMIDEGMVMYHASEDCKLTN